MHFRGKADGSAVDLLNKKRMGIRNFQEKMQCGENNQVEELEFGRKLLSSGDDGEPRSRGIDVRSLRLRHGAKRRDGVGKIVDPGHSLVA
ncbi:hypothetical protein QE408_000811 [Agrobacterium larrymoorei]|uniref:Uncharacterized protein n=1 Tax=Agrobacterium larrymoorei TaxID=160699 RepID=A0ABU0UFJ9_9HYPH|nr:hypothetical protein [Agrobacterium larrymoorei]